MLTAGRNFEAEEQGNENWILRKVGGIPLDDNRTYNMDIFQTQAWRKKNLSNHFVFMGDSTVVYKGTAFAELLGVPRFDVYDGDKKKGNCGQA